MRVCIIGGHVLQLELSYWSTCFAGWHILRMICLTGGHSLCVDRSYWKVSLFVWWTCLVGMCGVVLLSCFDA